MNRDIESVVTECVTVLKHGGIILYPTDTIWGIGCDATNETAVRRIFELKKRPDSKSMILLIDTPDMIKPYVNTLSEMSSRLLTDSSEPQTVIIPQAVNLAPSVMPPEKTIAVRCPNHLFCRRLLNVLGKPIVSTSANLSGMPAAITLSDIHPLLKKGVDYIVPAVFEENATGRPSRIVRVDEAGNVVRLR